MKKYFIVLSILSLVVLLTIVNSSYAYTCEGYYEINVNSKEFINYIYKNNIKNITEICTSTYCEKVKYNSIEYSFQEFEMNYLKDISDDDLLYIELKGYRIEKIKVNNC